MKIAFFALLIQPTSRMPDLYKVKMNASYTNRNVIIEVAT